MGASLFLGHGSFALADEATATTVPESTAPVRITSAGKALDIRFESLGEPHAEFSCTTPCSLAVPPGRYFLHATARGVRPSSGTFEVGTSGRVIVIEAGSKAGFAWGVVLTSIGASTVAYWGALVLPQYLAYPGDSYNQFWFATMSVATGLFGVGPLVAGLLLVTNNERGIHFEDERPTSRPSSFVPRPTVAVGPDSGSLRLDWRF